MISWKFDFKTSNCWHFVQKEWYHLTGMSLLDYSPEEESSLKGYESMLYGTSADFVKLTTPQSPCIAIGIRKRTMPHVGVYNNGTVIHASRKGVFTESLRLFKLGFKEVQFYLPKGYECKSY